MYQTTMFMPGYPGAPPMVPHMMPGYDPLKAKKMDSKTPKKDSDQKPGHVEDADKKESDEQKQYMDMMSQQ